ncbi:MAG: IclR family transcriptional regulator [Anaerorhabdus sp.]
MNNSEPKVKSLYKALQILDCFSVKTPELGISEIAKKLQMSKSNVHSIVQTMVYAGYLKKNLSSEKYGLTNKMLEFSYIITNQLSYQSSVQISMKKLASKVRGVIYFGVLHGSYVLYMFTTLSDIHDNNIIVRSIMGEKAPLYCTSLGKALLMNLDEEEILERVQKLERISYTPNTLLTDKQLLDDLALSKSRGYTEDDVEHEANVRCVGVPIYTHAGKLIGAMSVSGLPVNISEKEMTEVVKALQDAATEIRAQN